jgi:phosphoglycolate phosphatase
MEMLRHFGVEVSGERIERFYEHYLGRLEWNLAHGGFDGRVLPGVAALLERLAGDDSVAVGLLTGNIAGGARAKMRHYGMDRHFPFGAYGDDHHDRNELGPVALERAADHAGRSILPAGDPGDRGHAEGHPLPQAIDARCLAVATGSFSASQLRDHGAEIVVDSLVGFEIQGIEAAGGESGGWSIFDRIGFTWAVRPVVSRPRDESSLFPFLGETSPRQVPGGAASWHAVRDLQGQPEVQDPPGPDQGNEALQEGVS